MRGGPEAEGLGKALGWMRGSKGDATMKTILLVLGAANSCRTHTADQVLYLHASSHFILMGAGYY